MCCRIKPDRRLVAGELLEETMKLWRERAGAEQISRRGKGKEGPLYDDVVLSSASPVEAVLDKYGIQPSEKIVLFDCGGRGGAGEAWAGAIVGHRGGATDNFLMIPLGADTTEVPPEAAAAMLTTPMPEFVQRANANDFLAAGAARVGEEQFYDGFEAAWKEYRDNVAVGGLLAENIDFYLITQ